MLFYNDDLNKISKLINKGDIAEIAGISNNDFVKRYNGDINKLNKDCYLFSFSYNAKYKTSSEEE